MIHHWAYTNQPTYIVIVYIYMCKKYASFDPCERKFHNKSSQRNIYICRYEYVSEYDWHAPEKQTERILQNTNTYIRIWVNSKRICACMNTSTRMWANTNPAGRSLTGVQKFKLNTSYLYSSWPQFTSKLNKATWPTLCCCYVERETTEWHPQLRSVEVVKGYHCRAWGST